MEAFTVSFPDSALDDLKARLRQTRWPDEISNSGWEFGARLSFMRDLVNYWLTGFDWRNVENEINRYPNYIATVDSYKIHFMHIKGRGRKSLPLIITHGWPGSFLEMLRLIPLLTENADLSFDLVIPSMLGFGFSQRVVEPGGNVYLMADLWVKLMAKLGYEKFITQGGDFGSGVSTAMGLRHADRLIGIHLNYIPGSYSPYIGPTEALTEEETRFLKHALEWDATEGAYAHQQQTKPLTLAYGLSDSPAGLCAWIVEKFLGWAQPGSAGQLAFSKDNLLAQVTLYWLTGTIHSSIRLYQENSKVPFRFTKEQFVRTPVGIARFPHEDPFPPQSYIKRGYHVVHWTDMPSGGHFAAMEQPVLLANDIRRFAILLMDRKNN